MNSRERERERGSLLQNLTGIKSRSRVRERGEVFTETREVKAMCDLCEPDISQIDKKILEPGCGTGNFLVEILQRRLKKSGSDPYKIIVALSNIYGVDIAPDNVVETRERLRQQVINHLSTDILDNNFLHLLDAILKYNIVIGDLIRGKRKIYLLDWNIKPNGRIEVEKHNLHNIELARIQAREASSINELYTELNDLFAECPRSKPPRPKPKPKANPFEGLPMFTMRGKK